MNFSDRVNILINDFLNVREDLFLIDLKISPTQDITVIIDGDNGINLQDCLDASRAIENNLDREETDFSLQVTSPGLSQPLQLPRQYKKNIGRSLEITLNDDNQIDGELTKFDENEITIKRKYRKPKEIGKGKVDVEEEINIPFSQIKKAVVQIKF